MTLPVRWVRARADPARKTPASAALSSIRTATAEGSRPRSTVRTTWLDCNNKHHFRIVIFTFVLIHFRAIQIFMASHTCTVGSEKRGQLYNCPPPFSPLRSYDITITNGARVSRDTPHHTQLHLLTIILEADSWFSGTHTNLTDCRYQCYWSVKDISMFSTGTSHIATCHLILTSFQ